MFGNRLLTYPPFPRILFTLLAFTEDEKARYLANTSSIDDCISSAETWAYNRAGLSSALDGFDTRRELVVCIPCHVSHAARTYSHLGTVRRARYQFSKK